MLREVTKILYYNLYFRNFDYLKIIYFCYLKIIYFCGFFNILSSIIELYLKKKKKKKVL